MLIPRNLKSFAVALLLLYLPLVAILDLWHDHGDDQQHETCAACHFAASHAPVPDAVVIIVEEVILTSLGVPVKYYSEFETAAISRAPPWVLSSFVETEANLMKKDTRIETIFALRGAACGVHRVCV